MREGIGQTARVRLGRWARFGALVGVMLALIVCSAIAADTKTPSKREQLLAQRSKAWDLYYAGKYDEAVKATEQLEKSAAGDKDQRAAQLEAIHIIARCYWSGGDSKASRAEAQRRWKELEKADDYLANAARGRIAKALMLEDPKKPAQTAQAIALLEEVLKKAHPNTATAEAAIDLARLYIREKRFDDAKKVMDAGEEFVTRQVKLEMPQADAAPFLKVLKDLKAHLKYDATPGLTEFEAAEKLRKAEKFAEAIPLYQSIIKTYGETDYAPHSDLAIGQCLLGQKKLAEAVNHWKKFITPMPAGPWRGQAYVELIDLFLEEVLDLNEAGKYAELARASLPAALADAKAGDSWKAIAYDVQLRVGLVSFCQNKGTAAAEAFEEAKKLAPSKQAAQSLESLIAAAKSAKAVVPEDVKRDGKGRDNDKVALALSISVIYTVAGRYDDAQTFLDRVCGLPAVASTRPVAAHPPMSGASPAQLAFGTFVNGAVLEAKGNRDAAKEQFLASLKAFDAGTWHDETLYRVATIIQEQAERQHEQADTPNPKAKIGTNPPSHKERETREQAQKEQKAALVKAKSAALPYWRELMKRYSTTDKDGKLTPKSPRCEQALYNIGVISCEMAEVVPDDRSETAWKDAEIALKRFCETFPKSPYAGDAYVRQIDIALEKIFDLQLAQKLLPPALDWAKRPREDPIAELPALPLCSSASGSPTKNQRNLSLYHVHVRAGVIHYLARAVDIAAANLEEARKYAPPPEYKVVSGQVESPLTRLSEAIGGKKQLTAQEILDDDNAPKTRLILQLADLYAAIEDREKAAGLLSLAIRIAAGPNAQTARSYAQYRLAECHFKAFEFKDAYNLLINAQRSAPKASWAANCLHYAGNIMHNYFDDVPGAVGMWEEMLRKYPQSSDAHVAMFHIGLAYMWDHKWAKAKEVFDKFLKEYPDSPYVGIVRKVDLPRCEAGLRGEEVKF